MKYMCIILLRYLYLFIILFILLSCSQNQKLKAWSEKDESKDWKPFSYEIPGRLENEINCLYKNELVYKFSMVDVKPVMIKPVPPKYPHTARINQIQGTVVVSIIIDEFGNVIQTKIYESIPELDHSAIEAAQKCKFKPGTVEGKAVKVCMNVPFNYRLR